MTTTRKVRRTSYTVGRRLGDWNALSKALTTGSVTPIAKRVANKWIGRNIVSKMWFR
jgi:hypothetical protein